MSRIENFLFKIIDTFDLDRRVISRKDGEKYLTRYYIFRKPLKWMPSIYIHHFHSSDADQQLHNHQWKMSMSLILSGSYAEERKVFNKIETKIVSPGSINFIKGSTFHRVDLLTPEVWTLFISGPKLKEDWGFWDRYTNEFTPWQEFINKR